MQEEEGDSNTATQLQVSRGGGQQNSDFCAVRQSFKMLNHNMNHLGYGCVLKGNLELHIGGCELPDTGAENQT